MSSFSVIAPTRPRAVNIGDLDAKPPEIGGKAPGKLGGRAVEVMPKAGGVTTPKSPPGSSAPKPLAQRSVAREEAPPYGLRREARYGALPDKDQLIDRAGRPKDDISFGIFGTKKMSTGYKAVLGGLDAYKQGFERDKGQVQLARMNGTAPSSPLDRLEAMEEHLGRVSAATDKYVETAGHTHKIEMRALKSEIGHELSVLNGLMDDIRKGGSLPEGMDLSSVVGFARQGIKLGDMGEFHAMGLTPEGARDAIDAGLNKTQLQAYVAAGFNGSEAALLHKADIGIAGGQLYRGMHLAITPETIVKDYRDGPPLSEPLKKLGAGAFNTVYTAKYQTPKGQFDGVFKPLAKPDPTRTTPVETGWVAKRTGIDPFDPQIAMRNLATCALARDLGFDVVPHTEIGLHAPPGQQNRQLGLVMEMAQGRPARQVGALLRDPQVRCEVIKLQLLDHLTGQGDRHGFNYFVHKDPGTGKVRVTGIDNDQCFGKNLTDPNGIACGKEDHNKGFRGTRMPPVVDRTMYDAFRAMTPEKLEASLKGKLSPDEIAAAKERLQGIKAHMEVLNVLGMVIGPGEWGSELVDEALRGGGDNYLGRGG